MRGQMQHAACLTFGDLQNEEHIGMDHGLDVAAKKRGRSIDVDSIHVRMVRSTVDCTRNICQPMVEDGVLQVQRRKSRRILGTSCHPVVLLSGREAKASSLESFIPAFSTMRTYAKNYKSNPATVTRTTVHDYKNRESTEWDVRLDLVNGFTSSKLLEHAVAHKAKLAFCVIGAEEQPDTGHPVYNKPKAHGTASEEIHVHVAIILQKPAKRGDVLQLLRGPRPIGTNNEYAVPRNPKFTYAGWIAHHTKVLTKIDPNGPLKLYEFGDLPMDAYDEDTCWKVVRMIKKFGNDEMRARFKSYSDKLDQLKLAKALDAIDAAEEEKEQREALVNILEPRPKHVGVAGNIHRVQEKLGGEVIHIE